MKIFLDTANRGLIERHSKTGLIDGVTTNPSLLSKEGGSIQGVLKDICDLLPNGDISIEVIEKKPVDVYQQAKRIAAFSNNVVVKIPFHHEYLSVMKQLTQEGIRINVTLVFSPLQAMMVGKIGVTYISPFVGRWSDIGINGVSIIQQIMHLKKLYNVSSEILSASIRTIIDWQDSLVAGADVVTVPPSLFEKAMEHPLTDQGIVLFDNDWKKLGITNFF
jgi:transaldolase